MEDLVGKVVNIDGVICTIEMKEEDVIAVPKNTLSKEYLDLMCRGNHWVYNLTASGKEFQKEVRRLCGD